MSIKKEYITSDGFRFPEEQKELAEKHELYIDYLKAVMSTEDIVKACLDTCIPDNGVAEEVRKKDEVYVLFSLIKAKLSEIE